MLASAVLAATLASPQIEVYTMGPGEHLFERFGHAAICVAPEGRSEAALCYNYGTADFSSPPEEFGWEFLRGKSRFWVSVAPAPRMLQAYVRADRTIYRQQLLLTDEEARSVARALEHDALPENREYIYHHLRDNCSTRIRDIINRAVNGRLEQASGQPGGATFRGLARDSLASLPLTLIAADLFVGRQADLEVTAYQAMFLPDHLRGELEQSLSAKPLILYQRRGPRFPDRAPSTVPWWVAATLGTGLPIALARGARSSAVWWFALLGVSFLLGTLGLGVWVVAFLGRVPELRFNEALSIFLPTDLLLAFFPHPFQQHYARLRVVGLLLVSALLALGVFRQPLVAPLLLVLLPMALVALRKGSAQTR